MAILEKGIRVLLLPLFFMGAINLLISQTLLDSLLMVADTTTSAAQQSSLYKKIGDKYYSLSQDSTLVYYHKSLDAAERSASYEDDITILRSFAHLYGNRQNDYQTAKSYLAKGLDIAINNKDNVSLAIIKNDLGVMAKKAGDFGEAINCFFRAYELIQQEDDDGVKMRILLSLGVIHNETSYNEKAAEYYEEALMLADRNGQQKVKGVILNNLSKVYRDQGNYEKSVDYLQRAQTIFVEMQDEYWLGLVYYNFGYTAFLQEQFEEAIRYHSQALELNKISKEKDRDILITVGLAEVYHASKLYRRAIQHSLKGLSLLKKIETTEYYPTLYQVLGECYQEVGDYKQSSFYLNKHIESQERKDEEGLTSRIGQIQAMYEIELKSAAVTQLELKVAAEKIKEQKTSLLIRLLVLSFVLILTLVGLLFYRNKLKQTERNYELRNQLARDLHDNIGSSLNHIKIIVRRFTRQLNRQPPELQTIHSLSDGVISNMYDLIWSLDKGKEKVDDLIEYMRDHASNVLSPMEIPFQFKVDNQEKKQPISAEVKNNIYSIYKEAINNITKHTRPEAILIRITAKGKFLNVYVENDKRELISEKISAKLGLLNMKKRASLINGELIISDLPDKFVVDLTIKLLK